MEANGDSKKKKEDARMDNKSDCRDKGTCENTVAHRLTGVKNFAVTHSFHVRTCYPALKNLDLHEQQQVATTYEKLTASSKHVSPRAAAADVTCSSP